MQRVRTVPVHQNAGRSVPLRMAVAADVMVLFQHVAMQAGVSEHAGEDRAGQARADD